MNTIRIISAILIFSLALVCKADDKPIINLKAGSTNKSWVGTLTIYKNLHGTLHYQNLQNQIGDVHVELNKSSLLYNPNDPKSFSVVISKENGNHIEAAPSSVSFDFEFVGGKFNCSSCTATYKTPEDWVPVYSEFKSPR